MRKPVVTFLRVTIRTKYDTDMKTLRYFVLKLNLNIVFCVKISHRYNFLMFFFMKSMFFRPNTCRKCNNSKKIVFPNLTHLL